LSDRSLRRGLGSSAAEFAGGWRVLAAATLGVGVGFSSLPFYTAGLFIGPLRVTFGWTRAQAGSGNLALALGLALGALLVGRLVERFGIRRVALAGLIVEAAVFAFLSRFNGPPLVYAGALFAMAILGAGASPLTFTLAVSRRFERARGLALGVCLMGAGLAGALAPLLLGPVIAAAGWRAAYGVLAVVVLIASPLALALGGRGEDGRAQPTAAPPPTFRSVLSRWRFWALLGASALAAFAIAGTSVHFVSILTERGLDPAAAAGRASLIGLSVIATRVLIGAALDRLSARWVGAAVMAAAATGALLLTQASPVDAVAAALLLGAGLGAEVDLISFLAARDFGLAGYGRAYGLVYGGTLVAAGAGPFGFGLIADRGGYGPALTASAAALALAAALLLCLRQTTGSPASAPSARSSLYPR
jgi:predicted MFS family arabinose efflux permease